MNNLTKSMLVAISDNKIEKKSLVILLQEIAHELNIKTTAAFAKDNGLSYNGVKNHRPKITIGGVNFYTNGIEENNLPF